MYCGAVRQIPAEHFIENFNLPPLTFPIFGMAVGYPNAFVQAVKRPKPRLPTDIVLHHGSYKTFDDMDRLDPYNTVHKTFNGSPALYKKDYVDRLIERMAVAYDKKYVTQSLKQMGFDFK